MSLQNDNIELSLVSRASSPAVIPQFRPLHSALIQPMTTRRTRSLVRLEKLAWHVLDAIMLYGEQHRVMGMSLIEDLLAMWQLYLNSKSEACSESTIPTDQYPGA